VTATNVSLHHTTIVARRLFGERLRSLADTNVR
jgi:hypothetical protein